MATKRDALMAARSRTSLPYYAFLPAGFLLAVSIALFGSASAAVNAVVIILGVLIGVEGIALVSNWRDGADEFAARLRTSPESVFAFMSPWVVRFVLGDGFLVFGGIVIWAGGRYL